MSELPIGRVIRRQVGTVSVRMWVQFADHPFALLVFRQYVAGYLKGWSIGLIVKEAEAPDAQLLGDAPCVFAGRHILKADVVELSAVPVPSHPDTLSKMLEGVGDDQRDMLVKSLTNYVAKEGRVLNAANRKLIGETLDSLKTLATNLQHLLDTATQGKSYTVHVPGDKPLDLGDGLMILPDALRKSIEERGKAGKIPITVSVAKSLDEVGTWLTLQPLQQDGKEVKEAKILSVEIKMLPGVTTAPPQVTDAGGQPPPASGALPVESLASGRTDDTGQPVAGEGGPQLLDQLHLAEQAMDEAEAMLLQLDAELLELE